MVARDGSESSERRRRRIERRFASACASLDLSAPPLLLVATSGGPDSSALLLLLRATFAAETRLAAAYFDHRIRPAAERAAELAAVRRLTARAGVPLYEAGAPVPALARRHGRSLETEARVQRYAFLRACAGRLNAETVVTGHTADDQAETMLLHLLRGSGLRGLAGMRPAAPWPFGPGPRLVRPLLAFGRAETETYCRLCGFEPHEDSTNRSAAHTRNRVRQQLLPLLRTFNPRVSHALARLGETAAEQVQLLDGLSDDALRPARQGSGVAAMPLDALQRLPAALRKHVLLSLYAWARGDGQELQSSHLSALLQLVASPGEHRVDLPGGISGCTRAGSLILERSYSLAPPVLPPTALAVPGVTRVGPWEFAADVVPAGCSAEPGLLTAVIEATDPLPAISMRWRRPGDRMRPAGMTGSKKLQDLFVDARIPRSQRDAIPVICLGEEIVWAVGVRAAGRARVWTDALPRIRIAARRTDR